MPRPETEGRGRRESASGVIHDIGYRHYEGPRLGQWHLLRALYVDSLRGAFGLGRSARSKIVPGILFAFMTGVALIMAVVTSVTKLDELPVSYLEFPMNMWTMLAVFAAAQAPVLVSRDLRYGLMPLYFSRPLERLDYVTAKFAALASALFLIVAVPLLVLFVGALLAKLPVWHEVRGLLSGLIGALILALVLGGVSLVIAAITPRRGLGVAAGIAVNVVTLTAAAVLGEISREQGHLRAAALAHLINPFSLVDGLERWMFGGQSAFENDTMTSALGVLFAAVVVAITVGCYAALALRYRKVARA